MAAAPAGNKTSFVNLQPIVKLSNLQQGETYAAPQLNGPLSGPAVWTGEDLKNSEWWGHKLSKEDIDDIHQATETAKARGAVEWIHPGVPDIIAKEDFPLGPAMVEKMSKLGAELEDGMGLAMIENFPVG